VINVRLVVPARLTPGVTTFLRDLDTVTHVVVMPGAAVSPEGDAIAFDSAREAVSTVLEGLRDVGFDADRDDCVVSLEEVEAPSRRAALAERAAPGSPDDAIVWELVLGQARANVATSWSYYTFLALATTIAAVAVVTDSAVLIVGAMVVGPEFGPVSALAVGLVLRRWWLAREAFRLLVLGFAAAIAVTALLALVARAGGWISAADLLRPRPLTTYIWRPDRRRPARGRRRGAVADGGAVQRPRRRVHLGDHRARRRQPRPCPGALGAERDGGLGAPARREPRRDDGRRRCRAVGAATAHPWPREPGRCGGDRPRPAVTLNSSPATPCRPCAPRGTAGTPAGP
jgi:hypothetical protein